MAQLGERCVRNAEVEGSIPFGSILRRSAAAELCRMTYEARFSEVGRIKKLTRDSKGNNLKYVYLMESISYRGKRYVGITGNLNKHFKEYNSGKSPYTYKYAPWQIGVALKFRNNRSAELFEKYLKSVSGHAFAKRHFW